MPAARSCATVEDIPLMRQRLPSAVISRLRASSPSPASIPNADSLPATVSVIWVNSAETFARVSPVRIKSLEVREPRAAPIAPIRTISPRPSHR